MILIVDAGLGNVMAVRNMLGRIGCASALAKHPPEEFEAGIRIILPGVGSYDEGVRRLTQTGWFSYLKALPASAHLLGICLGMQLLGNSSTEGKSSGLGRVDAHFERFSSIGLRVPHIGWNRVVPVVEDPLFGNVETELRYYFTHSYRAVCHDQESEIARTEYGIDFTSAFRSGNTRGVQFHPEKSHRFGISLLKNWATLPC